MWQDKAMGWDGLGWAGWLDGWDGRMEGWLTRGRHVFDATKDAKCQFKQPHE